MSGRRDSVFGIVEGGIPAPLAGGRRFRLDPAAWQHLADRLRDEPVPVSALWSDGEAVHALLPIENEAPVIASVPVENGRYAALSPVRADLSACERIIRDLWGFEAMAARDLRPLLDHGGWRCAFPLAARPAPAAYPPEPPDFPLRPDEEHDECTQVGLGPVGSPLAGPAHLRLILQGDRIRRIDPLFGYSHRGVTLALRDRDPAGALRLAGRIDHSVAAATQAAVAEAFERLGAVRVPAEAVRLRRFAAGFEAALHGMQALNRLARALHRPGIAARFGSAWLALREAAALVFGPALLFDQVTLGGFADMAAADRLIQLAPPLERAAAALARHGAALREAAGADPVGRLVEDRMRVVWEAIAGSREGLREVAVAGPEPAVRVPERFPDGEAIGSADSGRGTLRCWIRLRGGVLAGFHLVDPVLVAAERWGAAVRGLRLERLDAAAAAADLHLPGLDQ